MIRIDEPFEHPSSAIEVPIIACPRCGMAIVDPACPYVIYYHDDECEPDSPAVRVLRGLP